MILVKNRQQMFMSSCIFLTTLTSFQFFYLWWESMNISIGGCLSVTCGRCLEEEAENYPGTDHHYPLSGDKCLAPHWSPPLCPGLWLAGAGITNNCLEMREQQPVLPSGGFTFVTTFHVFQITQKSNLLSSVSRLCHKLNWLLKLKLEPQLVTHNFDAP